MAIIHQQANAPCRAKRVEAIDRGAHGRIDISTGACCSCSVPRTEIGPRAGRISSECSRSHRQHWSTRRRCRGSPRCRGLGRRAWVLLLLLSLRLLPFLELRSRLLLLLLLLVMLMLQLLRPRRGKVGRPRGGVRATQRASRSPPESHTQCLAPQSPGIPHAFVFGEPLPLQESSASAHAIMRAHRAPTPGASREVNFAGCRIQSDGPRKVRDAATDVTPLPFAIKHLSRPHRLSGKVIAPKWVRRSVHWQMGRGG